MEQQVFDYGSRQDQTIQFPPSRNVTFLIFFFLNQVLLCLFNKNPRIQKFQSGFIHFSIFHFFGYIEMFFSYNTSNTETTANVRLWKNGKENGLVRKRTHHHHNKFFPIKNSDQVYKHKQFFLQSILCVIFASVVTEEWSNLIASF